MSSAEPTFRALETSCPSMFFVDKKVYVECGKRNVRKKTPTRISIEPKIITVISQLLASQKAALLKSAATSSSHLSIDSISNCDKSLEKIPRIYNLKVKNKLKIHSYPH